MRADLPHLLMRKQLRKTQWPLCSTWYHGTSKPIQKVNNYFHVSQRNDALEAVAHKQMIGVKSYGSYLYEVQLKLAEDYILYVEDWTHNHLGLAYAVDRALADDPRRAAVASALAAIEELAIDRKAEGLSADRHNTQFRLLAFDIFSDHLVNVGIQGLAYKNRITDSGEYSFCVLNVKNILSVKDCSKSVSQTEWQQAAMMAQHATLEEPITNRTLKRWD